RREMADEVRAAVGRLHPRDAEVIRLRYGLDGREYTLEEIGYQMGLTKERIRQIEKKAEAKLRTLLDEEASLTGVILGDVEPAASGSSECVCSKVERPVPAASVRAVSRDTRTFIQNGSG